MKMSFVAYRGSMNPTFTGMYAKIRNFAPYLFVIIFCYYTVIFFDQISLYENIQIVILLAFLITERHNTKL